MVHVVIDCYVVGEFVIEQGSYSIFSVEEKFHMLFR